MGLVWPLLTSSAPKYKAFFIFFVESFGRKVELLVGMLSPFIYQIGVIRLQGGFNSTLSYGCFVYFLNYPSLNCQKVNRNYGS